MNVVVLIAVTGGITWLISLVCWPYRPCTLCKGHKRHDSPGGKYFRPCLKCDGSGYQLRMALRIFRRMRA